MWKTSGCLTGKSKGTKKNKFTWAPAAIQEVVGQTQAPAAALQGQSPSLGPASASAPAGTIQYVDTAEKLEAAVAYIMATIQAGEEDTPAQTADAEFEPEPEPEPDDDSAIGTEKSVVAVGVKAGSEGLSLLQVGTTDAVFLFDCVALASQQYITAAYITTAIVFPLLANDEVIKVAFDMHQIAYLLAQNELTADAEFAGSFDIQLAIELLTSDPNHTFTECISQLHSAAETQQATGPGAYGRSTKSFDVRPLPPAARERAAKEMRDLLGIVPQLVEAVDPNVDAIIAASDLRAEAGAGSMSGSRQIAFDVPTPATNMSQNPLINSPLVLGLFVRS